MQRLLLLVFLTTIALDWPQLPFNARVADGVFVVAALAIVAGVRSWRWPRLQFLDIAIVVYLAGSALSVMFSPEPRVSAVELIRHIYVAAIYVVIALAVAQGLTRTIGRGLALSGGVLAIVGLSAAAIQMASGRGLAELTPVMTLPYIGETVRLRVLTASPAMFACVLAVSAPFALRHPVVVATAARTVVTAFILGLAAALTFSHSMAGIAVAVLIVAWDRWLSNRALRYAAVAASVLIVLAFNFAATVSIRSIGDSPFRDDTVSQYGVDSGRTQIAGVNVDYQTMSYFRIKQVAWDAFLSRPMFGVGLDRFHSVTEAAYQQGRLTDAYRAIDPHSTFVGRFAEAGVIGAVTLLLLWIAIGRAAARVWTWRLHYEWVAVAAVAALAGTLVNSMNADVMNFRFLWVVLGLVRGLSATPPTAAS